MNASLEELHETSASFGNRCCDHLLNVILVMQKEYLGQSVHKIGKYKLI